MEKYILNNITKSFSYDNIYPNSSIKLNNIIKYTITYPEIIPFNTAELLKGIISNIPTKNNVDIPFENISDIVDVEQYRNSFYLYNESYNIGTYLRINTEYYNSTKDYYFIRVGYISYKYLYSILDLECRVKDKLFHSDNDVPSYIFRVNLEIKEMKYYKNGKLHRDNELPAVIHISDTIHGHNQSEIYYKNGEYIKTN